MGERYLTAQEVADQLKIKKSTVYEMIKKRTLPAVKVGKQFRVSEEAVYAILGQRPTAQESMAAMGKGGKFVVCGQDVLLDILCDSANSAYGEPFFVRSHMGSYNGLHAMYQGQADAATAHLWDAETDTYNLPFISKLLPGEAICVYHLVRRQVGIYVAAGNPKEIHGIEDLTRKDIAFVSREKGSGIRVLVDSLLREAQIPTSQIQGYDTVVGSHLAAAAAVAGGRADCAFGNQKAAMQTPAIAFLPLRAEEYDIAFRSEQLEHPAVQTLLRVMRSDAFRATLEDLGGYDTTDLGKKLQ